MHKSLKLLKFAFLCSKKPKIIQVLENKLARAVKCFHTSLLVLIQNTQSLFLKKTKKHHLVIKKKKLKLKPQTSPSRLTP